MTTGIRDVSIESSPRCPRTALTKTRGRMTYASHSLPVYRMVPAALGSQGQLLPYLCRDHRQSHARRRGPHCRTAAVLRNLHGSGIALPRCRRPSRSGSTLNRASELCQCRRGACQKYLAFFVTPPPDTTKLGPSKAAIARAQRQIRRYTTTHYAYTASRRPCCNLHRSRYTDTMHRWHTAAISGASALASVTGSNNT